MTDAGCPLKERGQCHLGSLELRAKPQRNLAAISDLELLGIGNGVGKQGRGNQTPLTLQSLLFWKKQGFFPKKARDFLFAEPLKSLIQSYHSTRILRAAKRGCFKRGGFPIWTRPSFFVLFWDFPGDFPDLRGDGLGIFPIGPFPLSQPIKSPAQNQYMQEKNLGEFIFFSRIHAGPVFALSRIQEIIFEGSSLSFRSLLFLVYQGKTSNLPRFFFSHCRTHRNLGKPRENAKITKEIPCLKLTKEIPKTKERKDRDFPHISQILEGIHFSANTCRACIRTRANT